MSKSNQLAYGFLLVGATLPFFLADWGWIGAGICFLIGVALLISGHSRGLDEPSEAEILKIPHEVSKSKIEGCDDGPQIRLVWGIPKDFLAVGVHKRRLILENRSDRDAYRVQIENVSVDRNKAVTATFPEINLLPARATQTIEPKIIGRVHSQYVNEFEMVWANANEIPDNFKSTDENGIEWLKIPIAVTFYGYGKNGYCASFEFVDDQSLGAFTEVRFVGCESL